MLSRTFVSSEIPWSAAEHKSNKGKTFNVEVVNAKCYYLGYSEALYCLHQIQALHLLVNLATCLTLFLITYTRKDEDKYCTITWRCRFLHYSEQNE